MVKVEWLVGALCESKVVGTESVGDWGKFNTGENVI